VQSLKDALIRHGAKIYHYQFMDIHAGGHAKQDELKKMIEQYIHYYNCERPQWNLKKMTPVEYRNHLLKSSA